MKDDDRRDMALRVMFETLGTAAPTPAQIQGYRMSLDDIPVADLERAVRQAMRTARALPRPVELRELAGKGPNLRPYHLPYKPEPESLRKRVAESWEPARQLAASSEPTAAADILADMNLEGADPS